MTRPFPQKCQSDPGPLDSQKHEVFFFSFSGPAKALKDERWEFCGHLVEPWPLGPLSWTDLSDHPKFRFGVVFSPVLTPGHMLVFFGPS